MTAAGGDTCATAATLMPGTLNASTAGAMNDLYFSSDLAGCEAQSISGPGAPDLVFAVTVPASSRLAVTANASWDLVLHLVQGPATNCGSFSGGMTTGIACVDSADSTSSTNESVAYVNMTSAAQTIFVIVDGFGNSDEGAFTLTTTITALPAGDACSNAVSVTGNLTAQTLDGFAHDYVGGANGCASGTLENDRVYVVTVPAGQRLTATVTPDLVNGSAPFDPTINLVTTATCAAQLTCANGANGPVAEQPDTVIWDNTGAASRNVFIIVDTGTTSPMGTFRLDVSTQAVTFAAGETCGNVGTTPITTDTSLTAQSFAGYANNYNANGQACAYAPGPDRVYLVDVASNTTMTATATQATLDGGLDLTLGVAENTTDCGAGPCATSSDVSLGAAAATETVSITNTSSATRRVRIVVDSYSNPAPGSFALDVAFAPALPGEGCLNAVPITVLDGGVVDGGSTAGYQNDLETDPAGTGCTTYSNTGADKVFSVTVPAGQTLTATVSPVSGFDPGIYLLPGGACPTRATTCLAGSDVGASGAPDTLTYTNSSASAQNVFLVVDRYVPGTNDAFSLTLSLQ